MKLRKRHLPESELHEVVIKGKDYFYDLIHFIRFMAGKTVQMVSLKRGKGHLLKDREIF